AVVVTGSRPGAALDDHVESELRQLGDALGHHAHATLVAPRLLDDSECVGRVHAGQSAAHVRRSHRAVPALISPIWNAFSLHGHDAWRHPAASAASWSPAFLGR